MQTFSPLAHEPAWLHLRAAVEAIRAHQESDGSVLDPSPEVLSALHAHIDTVLGAIGTLSQRLPHDAAYHQAVQADLARWRDQGFGVPDFLDSLTAFDPTRERVDGREHVVVFAMYTQNGNPHRNLEAVAFRVVWPDWLAQIEANGYDNKAFLGITFCDFTSGYDTHSAVLFPETVAVREVPASFTWGAIFCDREAARFRTVATAALALTRLEVTPNDRGDDITALLADQARCQDAFVMWDMIHDRTHSRGDLPFDPFMIKQRQPFWMYGLEELRCDLTAFRAAVALEAEGVAQARDVQTAILFDRLFRFPLTGERVRNYDGLGGQLLFAWLHHAEALRWTDNRLSIDWPAAVVATNELLVQIEDLYRRAIDRPKLVHWLKAHEFVATWLAPHPGSTWAKGADALDTFAAPRTLVDDVLDDEFPLSMFYESLAKGLKPVIESTRGITPALVAA